MKKVITITLALITILSMTVISGCGDDKTTETKKPTPTVEPSISATVSATTESATQDPAATTSTETIATANTPATTAPATTAPVATTATTKPSPTATQKPSTPKPTATVVTKTDADLIIGTWETTVNLGQALKSVYAASPETAGLVYFLEDLYVKQYYEFKANGSYKDYFENGYHDKLEIYFGNFYKNLFIADAAYLNKPIEQYVAEKGFATLDDYVSATLVTVDIENNFPSSQEGTYTIGNGKIATTIDMYGGKYTETMTYTLTSSKLTITQADNETMSYLVPITYNKVA